MIRTKSLNLQFNMKINNPYTLEVSLSEFELLLFEFYEFSNKTTLHCFEQRIEPNLNFTHLLMNQMSSINQQIPTHCLQKKYWFAHLMKVDNFLSVIYIYLLLQIELVDILSYHSRVLHN